MDSLPMDFLILVKSDNHLLLPSLQELSQPLYSFMRLNLFNSIIINWQVWKLLSLVELSSPYWGHSYYYILHCQVSCLLFDCTLLFLECFYIVLCLPYLIERNKSFTHNFWTFNFDRLFFHYLLIFIFYPAGIRLAVNTR